MHCNVATATLPGLSFQEAVERIHTGIAEPLLGCLDTGEIQLCPQSTGQLTNAACAALRERYPRTRFRLHANARVLDRLVPWDASSFSDRTLHFYQALAERSRVLDAPAYTLHAGYRCNATLVDVIDSVRRLQDLFGIPVGVEGLYPRAERPQLMDSWAEYETAMCSGVPMAVDVSHLRIVATREGWQESLVREMLMRPQTIEVHLSANDGKRDTHDTLREEPWWWRLCDSIHPAAVVFSEGNQLRCRPRSRHRADGLTDDDDRARS